MLFSKGIFICLLTTYPGQQVAIVSVVAPEPVTVEHATLYPIGQIPGEKYFVVPGLQPLGKQSDVGKDPPIAKNSLS